ncbi:HTH-type transcriptional regulator GltC [Streptomyces sp. YIM 130001]|uniref:LysR family transcriptional regulator n=1 Tax=Streptomyces sp. YIM 130001 TaxID=2259644 RepID=UPI000E65347A|nr:LysR family transcriptional regulator [Streptomyces sp. YIM 130001]RII15917.1 HTH-type transcriptional regulator GltC [Streptomyces sp. YIM 130001]
MIERYSLIGEARVERHEIEAFLTVAEELHFGRATERLGLSQGRVSQTIKRLERRIGAPLFERSSRRVALTAVGKQLRDDLIPAHRQIRQAFARAVETAGTSTGTVRIGYSGSPIGELLLRAADTVRTAYAGWDVDIREVPLGNPLGLLRSGRLDLQVTELPVDEPDIAHGPVVHTTSRALLVPSGHPLATRPTVSLEDLADVELLAPSGDIPQSWLDVYFPRATPSGRPIPHGPMGTNWQELHLQVAAGKGVTMVVTWADTFYARPGVTVVPFSDTPPVEFGLLWPAGQPPTGVRAAYVDAVVREAEAWTGSGTGRDGSA